MSLGSMITQARKSAGLSIEDLSESTSIRISLLTQMESNDFTKCGGETYARGHIRKIASKLGVDAQIFLAAYEEDILQTERSMRDQLLENSAMRVPQEIRKVSWKVLIIISVSSLLAIGIARIVISN
jgi:cytoskeletal protein RodZ